MSWTACHSSSPRSRRDGQIQFRFAREHGYFDADHARTAQESGTPAWTN